MKRQFERRTNRNKRIEPAYGWQGFWTGVAVVLVAFLLTSCKTTQRAERRDYQLSTKKEYLTDSTRYKWVVETIKLYRPDGTLELEQVAEAHDKQYAIIQLVDTLTIIQRDTVYLYQESHTAEVAKTAKSGAWQVWGVIVLIAIAVSIYFYIRHRRGRY